MVQTGVGAVAVVEDAALVGIFTERDLMVKVVDRGGAPGDISLGEVMEREVITLAPDARRSTALTLMLENHVRHLPVVDDENQVLGMLSIRHLYREQLHRLQHQLDSLESYMSADGPGG
jgi:CBS domain-containing protein